MTKKPDYLKRYKDKYHMVRREDGIHYILTRYPDRGGMSYDVYDYSDTHLAACLPPRAADNLLGKYPGTFKVHQDGGDGKVLLFDESRLHELADALKIKQKRRISEAERKRLKGWGRKHSKMGLRKIAEMKSVPGS